MRVIVLTSSLYSTASHHLPFMLQSNKIEVVSVVYAAGTIQNKKKHYLRKLKKVCKIGILGTLNGIRMRKWYGEKLRERLHIENLEEICQRTNIPFYKTEAIASQTTKDIFEKYKADLGISLGNSYIPPSVFTIPNQGMINIHHEVLPDYPNAQSVIWQLYNGSNKTGYTIHKISKKIDAGEILLVEKTEIEFRKSLQETVTESLVKVMELSAKGLVYTLENFELLSQQAKAQTHPNSYTTPTISQFLRIKKNWKKLFY